MAGIGFELRKLFYQDSYFGTVRAYTYAGLISSGPWVISILAMLILGLLSIGTVIPTTLIIQFQTSATYLISSSLILTGIVQLSFTRYISDQVYIKNHRAILPNFIGLLCLTTLIAMFLSSLVLWLYFPYQSISYKILMVLSFTVLCNIWLSSVLLSSLKKYTTIVAVFFVGYAIMIFVGLVMRPHGLEGMLTGFFVGHLVLLIGLLFTVVQQYPSKKLISLDFLFGKGMFVSLVFIGLFYNLGLWVDKYTFWFNTATSQTIIGPLRASLIYDLPIFLAYLSIIPGMAVFLVRMETDFVENYQKFYSAILDGGSLSYITELHSNMVLVARQGISEIIKIQSIAILITFMLGPKLLNLLGIPDVYIHLLNIDVVAAGLQVVLLGLLNIFFYLDKRKHALIITAVFAVLNLLFTQLSIRLGPYFFGYGFALSLLVAITIGMFILNKDFEDLEFETFMLQ